jgi:stage V sporulation protein D (sporulation-specific penicillin-binding protein)
LAITFIFCGIVGRFFYVQTIWGSQLVLKATDQWNREIPIIASRGVITDCNGQIIVGNKISYSIFVRPSAVDDIAYTAGVLADIFELDKDALESKIKSSNVSEITIARQQEKERIEQLIKYDLSGVYYSKDNTRVYGYDEVLCQVLGFTSSDGLGISGLEKYYDDILSGTDGEIMYTTDIVGNQTEDCEIIYKQATDGDEVRLTIDLDIQLAAESAIKSVYEQSNAKSASCIVLDVNNFDILAMVNYPSYSLNDIPRDDSDTLNALSRNKLVCDIYEPGSTFKIITAAADIEEYLNGNTKAFSTSYIFNSSRTRVVDGTTVKCWSDHANGKHSNQTLALALNNSCNPCFTDIALSLGTSTFYNYLSAFGFGKRSGIDFFGEAYGLLVPQSSVKNSDLARIAFGQSVAVTPLQLACAAAAAINGGYYYTPHLLKSTISQDGSIKQQMSTQLISTPISNKASQILRGMLEGVVSDGSGKKAAIEGYRIGGKTGTAQKYENGRIAAGKYVASFVGFMPADDPQYLVLVIVDEPQGAYYGSTVAAPVAKEIFEDIIKIKNI